jgi:hypothetical protein
VRARDLLPACFLLFTALLVWPLLSIPNRAVLVAGLPSLVLYLFIIWMIIVAALVWAARRGNGDGP